MGKPHRDFFRPRFLVSPPANQGFPWLSELASSRSIGGIHYAKGLSPSVIGLRASKPLRRARAGGWKTRDSCGEGA
jgi:hypothetical protein